MVPRTALTITRNRVCQSSSSEARTMRVFEKKGKGKEEEIEEYCG